MEVGKKGEQNLEYRHCGHVKSWLGKPLEAGMLFHFSRRMEVIRILKFRFVSLTFVGYCLVF